ncbi:hypothetical protein [Massilia suwonensis]|uniref:DUF3396 domain-containing protein n=1 Tax=Massilia suwonensis TaxID=648895 RepID=A0ABW0MEI6_9BURK
MNLSQWHKKQAVLLYHFASSSYLEGLRDRVRALRIFAEGILDTSDAEGRDVYLRSKQWGNRNTGENWANNGWPLLSDFQRSVAQSIVDQRSNIYHKTGAYQCARAMSEFSMQWTTSTEQDQFDEMFAELYKYAGYIDETTDRTTAATRWDDFGLTLAWEHHAVQFPVLPKMRIRPDLLAHSGQMPPKTGVYVSLDDPDATLQFAWTGSPIGKLLDATTFNATGKSALAAVGRAGLWRDGEAMLRFVLGNLSNPDLINDSFFEDSKTAELAPSLVARNAFTSAPSRWCYVELAKDEYEPIEPEVDETRQETLRCAAGELCAKDGFYFSPAAVSSRRHFQYGEQFPSLSSDYGKTIWQWDDNQESGVVT